MNKTIFIFIAIVATGCTGTLKSQQGEINSVDRNRLIQVAKHELEARNLTLPSNYDVVVEKGEIGDEIDPSREIYMLHFSFAYRGKRDVVYTVFIDKRSGAVDQVLDYRRAVKTRI